MIPFLYEYTFFSFVFGRATAYDQKHSHQARCHSHCQAFRDAAFALVPRPTHKARQGTADERSASLLSFTLDCCEIINSIGNYSMGSIPNFHSSKPYVDQNLTHTHTHTHLHLTLLQLHFTQFC